MTTRFHIGAKELRGELSAYAKRFDLLEVRGMDAPNLRLAPSASTLRRWRRAVPPQFEFSVVAGPNLARLRETPELETELNAMLETAKVLESRILVLPTPSDVTPGKVWRDRFARVLERLPRDVTTIVWEPTGVWELEQAAAQAKAWGVVLAVDPSRDEVPAGPVAYGRLRSVGGVRSYSAAALERVAAAIGERRDAYVVIETTSALAEAKVLRSVVRQAGGARKAGLGRVIRPRGAPLRVRDDEQEE